MSPDPHLLIAAAVTMAAGYTMFVAGIKKHGLESKRRKRICPSCGCRIDGRVCSRH
jgi:hypothetical protein